MARVGYEKLQAAPHPRVLSENIGLERRCGAPGMAGIAWVECFVSVHGFCMRGASDIISVSEVLIWSQLQKHRVASTKRMLHFPFGGSD